MSDIKSILKYNVHRWLSPKVIGYRSSTHGLGIRAIEDIKRGEDVLVYGGVIIDISQAKEYWNIMGHIGTQIDDNFFIVPSTRKEIEERGTINHSCNPNTGFKDQIQLVAIRDISAGEEITLDYAFCETSYPMNFECNCKEPTCRKRITNNDWKIPELQNNYGDFFSPYIKRKFKS